MLRARLLRLAAAAIAGSVAATLVLLILFAVFDIDDWNTITVVLGADTPLAAAAAVYTFIFVGGAIPTLLIGAVLIALGRGTAPRLVFVPATLFVLLAAEFAREAHSTMLSLLALPAIVIGGGVMSWILPRQEIARPPEAAFE